MNHNEVTIFNSGVGNGMPRLAAPLRLEMRCSIAEFVVRSFGDPTASDVLRLAFPTSS